MESRMEGLRLPRLISDGMVLQRDMDINVWGWSDPCETVTVEFLGSSYSAVAGEDGKWSVKLPPHKAGGPYSMRIVSGRIITVRDILIGDVWVCSGQSNMVVPMSRVSDLYAEDIALSYNLLIRFFIVPDRYEYNTAQDDLLSGRWETTSPESILHFPATGYFFAKTLFERYHVPIGIMNASVGGSPVEAWLSEDSLRKFPAAKAVSDKFKDSSFIESIKYKDEASNNNWYEYINRMDEGSNGSVKWFEEDYDASDWSCMQLPAFWEDEGLGRLNGVVWFRKEFEIGPEMAGKPARLLMGRIIDSDTVYVNGLLAGTTAYQYPPRKYAIPGNVLKEGKNVIVVRVVNTSGKGGFAKGKPYKIIAGEKVLDLKGEWRYKVGTAADPMPEQTYFPSIPLGLFNGMLSPLMKHTIKGLAWYQGETNIWRPEDYQALLAELINDWREKWKQGNIPFVFVQLPNFQEQEDGPSINGWVAIREAQLKTLSVPNTGMAVAIDAGEWNDLHPLNKKAVGTRLALAARKVAYGEVDLVYTGPIFKSMTLEDGKLALKFGDGCGKLAVKGGGELKRFEIAGDNGMFIQAEAIIKDNRVIVWNDRIGKPKAVRYAWVDNPEGANLYNEEGLPASPFRSEIP